MYPRLRLSGRPDRLPQRARRSHGRCLKAQAPVSQGLSQKGPWSRLNRRTAQEQKDSGRLATSQEVVPGERLAITSRFEDFVAGYPRCTRRGTAPPLPRQGADKLPTDNGGRRRLSGPGRRSTPHPGAGRAQHPGWSLTQKGPAPSKSLYSSRRALGGRGFLGGAAEPV